jgi:hypothetical protein
LWQESKPLPMPPGKGLSHESIDNYPLATLIAGVRK